MKILWIKSDFLHPTTKGGHIRSLEMLKRLSEWHHIHYVAFTGEHAAESLRRSSEYCAQAYPIPSRIPSRRSPLFWAQLVQGLFSKLPVAVMRYRSAAMRREILDLRAREKYDAVVCDFLVPAPNIAELQSCVLFQHNVETMIWRRHAQNASNPLSKWYFGLQARRMFEYERAVCRTVRHVIGVSPTDADMMQGMFDIPAVSSVPTGVDVDYFRPPENAKPITDLVFLGSMDWLPNIDGVRWFLSQILPLIRQGRPNCSVAIVGRDPTPEIRGAAERDPLVSVTGTVPDVRSFLWQSAVSIVPLRIGGGTRLKIYESMAAGVATVSTSVGAEGLEINPPHDIRIAETPQEFAHECLHLLENEDTRRRQALTAMHRVGENFSWERVAREFEKVLRASPPQNQ